MTFSIRAFPVSHAKQLAFLVVVAVVALALFAAIDAEFFNHAMAASGGADSAFSKGEEKGDELAKLLAGKIAVTITTIVAIICGLLMQMGRLSHMVGVRVIVGTFIVGCAADLAAWAYS